MEEYLNYLNTVKNSKHDFGDGSHRGSQSGYRKSNQGYNSGIKKKRYQRDFKDLDDPEQFGNTTTSQDVASRKLISYDDL